MDRIVRAAGFAALSAVLAVAGCAGSGEAPSTVPERPLRLETIRLVMTQGANDNSPARVDLVRVEDVTLVRELLGIEVAAWFAGKRGAFKSAHPEVFFNEWEPVPGVVVGPEEVELDDVVVAGVLFCESGKTGAPIRLESDGDVVVRVSDEGCEISGGTPSKEPAGLFDALKGLSDTVKDTFLE